jgi:phage host-nuclease inhibitor protein Gam
MSAKKILSEVSLESAVAEVCRRKLSRASLQAQMEAEVTEVQKTYAKAIAHLGDEIAALEELVYEHCLANRGVLFPEKKSRETASAVFGFETTPPRVETVSRKVTWKEVVKRALRLDWAKKYVTTPDAVPNKQSLIADRNVLTAGQKSDLGVQFLQDEMFFIRPKSEIAEGTSKEV